VFNEISLLTGFYWSQLYKYKIRLNLETGMENEKLLKSTEFWAGSFCIGTLGWPIGCSGVAFCSRKKRPQSRRQNFDNIKMHDMYVKTSCRSVFGRPVVFSDPDLYLSDFGN
jgi:hypothetical protein